jgi:hypothetical protein
MNRKTFTIITRTVGEADHYAEKYGLKLLETEAGEPGHVAATYLAPKLTGAKGLQRWRLQRVNYLDFVQYPPVTIGAKSFGHALSDVIFHLHREGWQISRAQIDPDFEDAADIEATLGDMAATFSLDREGAQYPAPLPDTFGEQKLADFIEG